MKVICSTSLCLAIAAFGMLPAIISAPVAASVSLAQSSTPISSDLVITLERTVCFGFCPAYRISVYGDGRVVYEGQAFVAVEGTRTAQLSPEQVQQLVAAFEAADFFELDDQYTVEVTDLPSTITSIWLNGQTKQVVRYGNDAPQALIDLESMIDQVVNSQQWIES